MAFVTLLTLRYLVLASGILLGASIMLGENGRVSKFASRRVKRFSRFLAFSLLAFLLVGEPTVWTWLQYRAWASGPPGSYLLPPYEPWSYFTGYAFFRFWLWRILGVGIAGILYVLADRFIIRPSDGFRMNREENTLIAFGIALVGWPYLLIYIITLLLLYVVLLSFLQVRRAAGERRFSVALPATLALASLPFANSAIEAFGLSVLRVTSFSV